MNVDDEEIKDKLFLCSGKNKKKLLIYPVYLFGINIIFRIFQANNLL